MRVATVALLLGVATADLTLAQETTGALPRPDAPAAAPVAPSPLPPRTFTLTVAALKGRDLVGPQGEEFGRISHAVERSADKERFLAVSRHGLFRLLPDVLISLDHVGMRNGQVVAHDLTEVQIAALLGFDKADGEFHVLEDDQSISLADLSSNPVSAER